MRTIIKVIENWIDSWKTSEFMICEGGSTHVDGEGPCLTTEECNWTK